MFFKIFFFVLARDTIPTTNHNGIPAPKKKSKPIMMMSVMYDI